MLAVAAPLDLSEFDVSFASGLTVLMHLDIVGVTQADTHQTAYPRMLKPQGGLARRSFSRHRGAHALAAPRASAATATAPHDANYRRAALPHAICCDLLLCVSLISPLIQIQACMKVLLVVYQPHTSVLELYNGFLDIWLIHYSKSLSIRNRVLGLARLDFLSGLRNRAIARPGFLN